MDLRKASSGSSGTIGKEWIYWDSAGNRYRRPYVIPFDPLTIDQHTQRAKFYIAKELWNSLTPTEQDTWKYLATTRRKVMTGYNYFMSIAIKEVTVMVKQVIRGQTTLTDGVNVILIPEIYLAKSSLNYNSYLSGDYDPDKKQTGIMSAYLSDSTHITALCKDSAGVGTVLLTWEVIEYV